MVDKEYIRKLYFVKGLSIREISRRLGHSRVTVRKMLKDSDIPRYQRRKPTPSPVMDPFREVIQKWLDEDENYLKTRGIQQKEFTRGWLKNTDLKGQNQPLGGS